MLTERQQSINTNLIKYIKDLDIPPSKYKEAMERYASLKRHLEEGNYPENQIKPEVYIQGSFRLGTVIRPYKEGKDSDYDIDIVCRLEREKYLTEPEDIKNDVGEEVKAYAKQNSMNKPENKRRCWVLGYALDSNNIGFHMDVLPCIYDRAIAEQISRENPYLEVYANTTIAVTNRNDEINPPEYDWRSGNPHGYAKWFWDINRPGFVIFEKEEKQLLFEGNRDIYSSYEDVPNELVRTPLQRVIQILKRHRDIFFAGHKWEKYKPISIIITTLASRLYQGNTDRLRSVYSAFDYIVGQLSAHSGLLDAFYLSEDIAQLKLIQRVHDKWYISNPVNPHNPSDPEDMGENFADRWDEDGNVRAKAFFEWIRNIKGIFEQISQRSPLEDIPKFIEANTKATKRTLQSQLSNTSSKQTTSVISSSFLSRFDVPHKLLPRWPIRLSNSVSIKARVSRGGFNPIIFNSNSNPLPKNRDLEFESTTNVPPPFDVYWQVVNTGSEAKQANQLRGSFEIGELKHRETTRYTGMHWIECLIIKNGQCVARSGEFVVNIQ